MLDTLPKAITPRLREFCLSISVEKPIFIQSKPSCQAKFGFCFDNVEAKISRAGGRIAYGWAIWHLRDIYFEAEHHGVWQNKSGKLLDVSPQANSYSKILFLPDSSAIYDAMKIRDNLFAAASDDSLATEFVSLAKRRTAIYNAYRAGGAVLATLNSADQCEIERAQSRMEQIINQKQNC